MFSGAIEDLLLYSVPHIELLVAVRELLENCGTVAFQNSSGVTVEMFLKLLTVHLSSTVVSFDIELLVQKRGICIGSCLAPFVCHIF